MWRRGGARPRRRSPALTIATEPETQRAVLDLVLFKHPAPLTFDDLADELFENPDDFIVGYAVARAVRDLVVEGLLHSNGLVVMPTRAALRFARLAQRR